MNQQERFNVAYHQSRPPIVQRLRETANLADRQQKASSITLPLDYNIDIQVWDAFTTMSMRESYGYRWVPSSLQPPIPPPTFLPVPPGGILVSTDILAYPKNPEPRNFGIHDYFQTVATLNELEFYTANRDRYIYLAAGAYGSPATEADLSTSPSTVFPGAAVHFGILLEKTGRVFDAEDLSTVIPGGTAAVRAFIGL